VAGRRDRGRMATGSDQWASQGSGERPNAPDSDTSDFDITSDTTLDPNGDTGWRRGDTNASVQAADRTGRSVGRSGRAGEWADDGEAYERLDEAYQVDEAYQRARAICLRLLTFRPRTRAELADALRRRGVRDEIAAAVLERFSEVGMIDDAAFARAWVTSRHHGRGLAGPVLAAELRRRGVASETVKQALKELDQDTEETTARALVQRRLRVVQKGPPEAAFRRLVGMLARKGYPAGLAVRVVREALAEQEEYAEFADSIDPDMVADAMTAQNGLDHPNRGDPYQ